MRIDIIIFIAIGLAILIGFLKQFGILSGKGLIFTIAGCAAIFGWSMFVNGRRSRIKQKIKEEEKRLKAQEKKVKEMMVAYEENKEEIEQLQAVIERARLDAAKRTFEAAGGKLLAFYLVTGQYDAVFISEAPDNETAARIALATCSLGNVRTETLPAFTEDEYRKIVAALP